MLSCSNNECNQSREPCSRRGSVSGGFSSAFNRGFQALIPAHETATSVEGVGTGAACPKPTKPIPAPVKPKRICRNPSIVVISGGKITSISGGHLSEKLGNQKLTSISGGKLLSNSGGKIISSSGGKLSSISGGKILSSR